MPKKTASRTRKHPEVSGNQTEGLLAKGKEPRQSVRERSVLDNRSHRTPGARSGSRVRQGAGARRLKVSPGPAASRTFALHAFRVEPSSEVAGSGREPNGSLREMHSADALKDSADIGGDGWSKNRQGFR